MEIISKSLKDTKKIAEDLVQKVRPSGARVIALYGDLGSGKTTFAQFFAKALGVKEKVLSPTFVIVKTYGLRDANLRIHPNDANRFKFLIHADTYRLAAAKDLLDLGFKEMLKSKENIILIEWPEKVEKLLPKNTIKVYFETTSEKERVVIVK